MLFVNDIGDISLDKNFVRAFFRHKITIALLIFFLFPVFRDVTITMLLMK